MKKVAHCTICDEDLEMNPCELYRKYESKIYAHFGWIEQTKNRYSYYVQNLFPYVNHLVFSSCVWDDYRDAIQRMNEALGYKYKESTLQSFGSIVRDLCRFAEIYTDGRYRNPMWGVSWGRIRDKGSSSDGNESSKDIPKSLSVSEEVKLMENVEKHFMSCSFAMGLAIMFYLGLRPGECCGLTYDCIRPLEGYPKVNCLYIYKQIRSTDEATNSLKTTNAYRILPIPTELDEMLSKRKAKLSEGGKDISLWPIVSQDDGTGISMPCKRRYFANYCKEQLRLAKVKEEVVLEMDYEAKRHPEEEADATSYLIRRNLATAIQSECSFDYDEKQYVMGHAIDTPNERRRDFVNPDLLYEIWMKFNQRSLHRKYSDFFTADIGTLRIHQKSAEVTITDECIRKHGGSVLINIYNSDVNDKIDIKVKKLETAPQTPESAIDKKNCIAISKRLVDTKNSGRLMLHSEFAKAVQSCRNRSKL